MSFADVLDVLVTEFPDRRSPGARKERRVAKKKDAGASTKSDQTVSSPTGGSRKRHIPAAVRDEVYTRDGGQCTFVGPEEKRCESRKGLEIDHIIPIALGGTNETDNLRLLCPAHNLRAAERALGKDIMAPFWRRE